VKEGRSAGGRRFRGRKFRGRSNEERGHLAWKYCYLGKELRRNTTTRNSEGERHSALLNPKLSDIPKRKFLQHFSMS
jgi:hypothetical protein